MTSPPPGWYPDPQGMPVNRYWDENGWSAHTQPWQVDYRYAPWRRPSGAGRVVAVVLIVPVVALLLLLLLGVIIILAG